MPNSQSPVVETSNGKVRGAENDGVFAFKAIPYGASTAGANRFMPPQKPQAWAGVRDCLDWGPSCPQSVSGAVMPSGLGDQFREFFGMTPDVPNTHSEDCLILNVFTPGVNDGKKRPVMVWIHGGGFEIGSGSGARSNGSNLARKHDVVTVSMNHRLGVLGYCDLSSFNGDFARSATVGQQDLILALKWVRDNIEAFGGDPNKVMIHGESGGGAKVSTLMGMPRAKGLFQRAICQSGVARGLPGPEQGIEAAGNLLREMNLTKDQLLRLQQAPIDQVLAAAKAATAGMMPMSGRGFAPAIGGADLPISPFEAVAAGSAAEVPLVVGCTKHEATLFLAGGGTDLATIDEARLQQMSAMMGPQGSRIVDGYRANHPDYTPGDILVRSMTDNMMRLPSIKFAEAHLKGGGAGTWMYLFTWESPALPHLQAAHGIDGTFYFDNTETVNIAKGNDEAQRLAGNVSTAWATFARTGKPSAPGLPAWPRYDTDARETMIFSGAPHLESDPLKDDRLMRQHFEAA